MPHRSSAPVVAPPNCPRSNARAPRERRTWRAALRDTLVLALLASAAACERAGQHPDGPAPTAESHAPEREARTAHYTLRVLDVVECKSSGLSAPSDDSRRLGVELSLEPTGELQVPANPYYARLVDERQQVYEATLGSCGMPLAPRLPQRGHIARGQVVFDVPRAARHWSLLYAPELVGAPKEEVSIALGAR